MIFQGWIYSLTIVKMVSSSVPSKTKAYDRGLLLEEEFEDTKGVIRIRISKKDSQHNDQKKKYKRTNNDLQNITRKLLN
jgi:hypothetical protein